MARQGKLRDDAYARSLTSSSDLVPISIWADFGDAHAPREQIISNSTLRAAHQAQTASRLRAVTSKVTKWLDARGYRTYERGTDSPVITADVPASALAELGRLDGAGIVHLRYPDVPAGFTWFDAVKGPAAHAIVGSVGGLAFCNAEGYQPNDYTYLTPSTIFDPTSISLVHTTWTTELISATGSTRMAPGASPYITAFAAGSGNYTQFEAWSWCTGLGIHNMNRSSSYGSGPIGLLAEDMAQDYYAYHWPWPLITLSAGNCLVAGDPGPCPASTNGVHVGNRSYNALVVGASDNNTTSQTSDDFIAEFSQYLNPNTSNDDFELPNLVAPGSDIHTTNISSASVANDRGTSASAPITLGTVLLMKYNNGNLNYWPEEVRAIVLTASTHPVNGGRADRLGNGTDRKQGAGLLNAAVAVSLANSSYAVSPNNAGTSQGHGARWYDFSTDFPSNVSAPYNIVTWNAGRLRVVATWDATAQNCDQVDASGCLGDVLDADLDLRISRWTGSSWQAVLSSTSYDSSWEVVDIAVGAGEIYKAELIKYSANSAGTYVGIAWNNYDPNAE